MLKKSSFAKVTLLSLVGLSCLTGCGAGQTENGNTINVVSREEGSGTRGAFIELFGIEEKTSSGDKVDKTTDKATVTNSTAVMLTTIASDPSAIGYVSLGALDDQVKVLDIDGEVASAANIKSGDYKIARDFNLVTKSSLSALGQDFMTYILSSEGQAVVEDKGYITVNENAQSYKAKKLSGKLIISGSSSVTPVMEKLKEAYLKLNPDVTIEVQQSDSSTGIANTIEGICDIGMASRDLKDQETSVGLTTTPIAHDGIGVIVNKANKLTNLTSEQVKEVFTGEISEWNSLKD